MAASDLPTDRVPAAYQGVMAPLPRSGDLTPKSGDPSLPGAPRTPSRSERRLAARLSRGDQDALREIQDEYSGMLRGYLRRMLSDDAGAEDVLQQVMLEVWQRGSRFDPSRGSATSWLMTITRSRAIDHMRRRVPEPRDPHTATQLIDRLEPQQHVADELAEQWRMAHLLTKLPREEAQILRLRFHGDMTQTEIAAETGMPLGTVKMRMVSALGRLAELMDEEA
jgi:RNA polymerase sigma-70 factor, ECF subfamily